MEKVKLKYSHDHTVASVILDDGKGNVLDYIMIEELQSVFHGFQDNSQLKLIILEGAGKHFSFGASVEEHKKEFAQIMLKNFHELFYILRDLSIPLLAKVSGQCLGGGLELAIMCNFIFADKSARFGLPEIVLGVFPPVASIILPEKIGLARAENILQTGKILTAEEAREYGIITKLFENRTEMNTGVEKWIEEQIIPKSASSLRFAVKASRAKFNHVLTNFLPQLETMYIKQLMETHDANEGIHSFLEKRKPIWENNKVLSK